jgi:hypothetical protein
VFVVGETSRLDELRGLVQERRYVAAVRLAKALLDGGALDPSETAEVRHVCAIAYYCGRSPYLNPNMHFLLKISEPERVAATWSTNQVAGFLLFRA